MAPRAERRNFLDMTSDSQKHRLLIAGAGVAGLEALAALRAVAPNRFDTTVVAPNSEFKLQAASVEEPFARPHASSYSVPAICADHGATHLADGLAAVNAQERRVSTVEGSELAYDSLLVAVGATREPVFAGQAIVFRGDQDAEAMQGLIQDIEGGYTKRVVFIVPSGVTWPLPLYELAMMTARRAREMSEEDVSLVFITPEELPMAVFGQNASAAVGRALDEAGVELLASSHVDRLSGGQVHVSPSGQVIDAQRVVTVPRLQGPAITGLPADDHGFMPVDEQCRVRGVDGVFAAGDGTTFPVKQGGVAAQQADAAALAIARAAGVEVDAQPFDPVLRAKLLTGARAAYLREALGPEGGEETSTASEHALWWPPSKVAAPYLTGYLAGLGERPHGRQPPAIHAEGDPSGGIELLEE
jgi:sulfide:quinone oxidoreductase